jgi:branched-chain amino acid transport system substrate-binding protein
MNRRLLVLLRTMATIAMALAAGAVFAQANAPVRIGVLTDMQSGFSAWSGKGSVIAAQMAAEDYERGVGKLPYRIEVISADHQNKADIGSSLTRKWLDEGVSAIVDVPNSAVALAVNFLVKNSNAALLISGGGGDALTGKDCSPNTVQWTFDLWSLARNTASAAVERGGDTWYFITADYAGGLGLEGVASKFAIAAGGRVVGTTRPALNTQDYSSFLLQAQSSKAKIVALAMGGADFVNAVKQAGEFGLTDGGQKLVALAVFINDIHSLGLQAAKGLIFTTAFYWDIDEGKRTFAKRFAIRSGGDYPSDVQAGVYASVLHYLKATTAAGTRSGQQVVAKMKELPTDDPLFGRGTIRADGRQLHDMYVMEVKRPQESRAPWDYLKLVQKIPAEKAFRPASPEECSLVKR